jgi:hypothetical protein
VKWRGIRELAVDFAESKSVWEGYINKNFLTGRPPSLASQLPQGLSIPD